MFRHLILLFLLIVSLHALSDNEVLRRADNFMRDGSKSNQFRAYNDYKNLYLRAIMSEDLKLRIRSLQGIVKSGRKLHIDVSQYSEELSNIKPKTSYKAPKSKQILNKNKKSKIKIKSSHKLKSVRWRDSRLVLKFDKKLSSKQINYFTLYDSSKNQYRYIFDIHASMLSKSQTLRKDGIKRIKLAQYNSNTLRLVIENSQKLKVSYKKESKQLVVNIRTTTKKTKYVKTKTKDISPQRIDRNKIIVIDAGHGGKDPGAVGYKRYREKVVVLQISNELKRILKARGYKVYMSRTNDRFVKLRKRTEHANKKHADIFISIHANSVSRKIAKKACGIECYFLSPSRSKRATSVAAKENSADMSDMKAYEQTNFLGLLNRRKIVASNKLAIDLQGGMLSSLGKSYKNVKDGGVREGPFWVLDGAQMPADLVEVGFISNPTEAKRLVSRKYQKKLATGLADGIERYFANN
jgi:N-acetylmuramoyl-L-alanine amidase